MKTILSVLLVILATHVWAQTQITSPTVSGNWTLAGSPYVVNVNINIAANTTLSIQPGVVVRFKSTTHLIVDGSLIANGSASQYITFQADDTTGWANENITLGGWNGIHFMAYTGTGTDNSALSYCIIKDTKYGYNTSVSYANTLSLFRKIKVAYCDIYHNTAGTGLYVAGNNISISTSAASDTIELDHCKIYDNTTVFGILYTGNNGGGFTSIHHCDIHDNSKGSPIWGVWNNVVIEYNDIHHNTMINDSSPIKLSIGVAKIRFNKVHHNICDQLAAIGCRSGLIDCINRPN